MGRGVVRQTPLSLFVVFLTSSSRRQVSKAFVKCDPVPPPLPLPFNKAVGVADAAVAMGGEAEAAQTMAHTVGFVCVDLNPGRDVANEQAGDDWHIQKHSLAGAVCGNWHAKASSLAGLQQN